MGRFELTLIPPTQPFSESAKKGVCLIKHEFCFNTTDNGLTDDREHLPLM